jgi:hypothetical protein
MTKLSHNLKYDVALFWYAFGEVYGPGKRAYPNMHFTAGTDHRGKSTPCGDTSKQELGIKFTHLILNGHKQCGFDSLHAPA